MKDQKKTPEERQLRMMKLQTCMIAGILVLVLVFVAFLVIKVNDVTAMIEQVDLDQINSAVTSLKNAADNLASVDTDSLNTGIRGLSEAAGQMSQLDFAKLNSFMDSLEAMGQQMDAVTSLFKNILHK